MTTDGTFKVTPLALESHDQWALSADGHTVTFNLDDHGDIDGLVFTPVCGSYVTLQAATGKHPAVLREVSVGGVRWHSLGAPLTITRSS